MNTLCLSTSLSLTTASSLLSSPHSLSPFLSFLRWRGPQSSFLHSCNRIKTHNINNNILRSKRAPTPQKYLSSPSLSLFSQINKTSTPLFRQTINNINNINNTNKVIIKRHFHATRPAYAGLHVFRLASFVAPIVMRSVRTWIGTPSTNSHFVRRLMTVVALLLGLPAVYIYTHLETTPYTDRVRFVALTSEDEAELGEIAFNQLIDEHETNFIPGHHRFVAKVTEVADRIIEACERPDIKWEVRLIDSPVTNAFAIPGGKIFVFSGLLDVTENDDGLAFILGHEVAHVLARHGAEQMTVERVMLGFSVFLSAIFGDNIGSFGLSRVISVLTELRYSRNMEREADYIGLLLMKKAKYDINEAPKVWERMVKKTGDGDQIPFLSTHPSHGDRIHDISQWVEEIKVQQKDFNNSV